MPISNIEAVWNSGDLTFQNKATKADILKLDDAGTITIGASVPTYATSNVTTTRTIDADSTSDAEVADVLCSLIVDLQAMGILAS